MAEPAVPTVTAFPVRKMSIIKTQVADGTIQARDENKQTSKHIRYRTHYQDDSGEFIKAVDNYEPTNLQTDSDDEDDPVRPVLDIITYVTVRTLVTTKHINTEKAAKAVGEESGEESNGQDIPTKDGEMPGVTGLKIQSIGSTEMAIRSPSVQKALRSAIKYYPGQKLAGKKIIVPEPYYVLFHHQKELESIATDLKNGTTPMKCTTNCQDDDTIRPYDENALDHIQVLLAFLNARMKKKIEAEERRYRLEPPRATFEMMWMLLKPGTQVYSERAGELDGFIVKSIEPLKTAGAGELSAYKLVLWSLDFDGQCTRRVRKDRFINAFDGERDIIGLETFPVSLEVDGIKVPLRPERWEKLIKRGDKYWEYLKKGCVQVAYDGILLGSPQSPYKGKAILDPESYYMQKKPKKIKPASTDEDREDEELCQCNECKTKRASQKTPTDPWAGYKDIDPQPRAKTRENNDKSPPEPRKLTDGHFFLFPKEIPGFILKTREWEVLDITCLDLCEPNPDAIDKLRIAEARKNMIKMLSHKYTRSQREGGAWSADFVQNKGEGQIFLLHGPSGVGKTYTAECIAEMTGRPLLSLSVADIGTDEKVMENQLKKWFDLAERWEAIMLIDEADVYFERRASGQLQRNSLVSSFLRSMEYYRGILFLTTNRLGAIDDAIISRIHLVLEYKDLDKADRAKIWQQFFNKLTSERDDFEVSRYAEEYVANDPEILELEWNGREIRNAFQTAVALAEYEAKVLNDRKNKSVIIKKEHFVEVAQMSKAFKGYMTRSFGDAAKRAWLDGVRMDDSIREYSKKRREKFEKDRQAKLAV